KYGLEEARLRQLVEKGKIRAGVIAGEMVVSEDEVRNQAVIRKEDLPEYKKHAHLHGIPIGFTEASDKYGINLSSLQRWFKKGIIAEVKRERTIGGEKIYLNEADVAYCAEIYHSRGGKGKWLFDKNGLPYKPKTGPLAM
ncbi:MAG TPA: hypothetical protein DCE76_07610, partial [Anaerolineaceae bacterium]|nr:hypothetical protein [Anaerolineaceae bacterium]